jgi:hypothetical protein
MKVHGYIYRQSGLLRGQVDRVRRMRPWSHHGVLRRVASQSSWSPHFICSHCGGVYVQMGEDIVRCETPDICVVRPQKLLERRRFPRPRVQAGPLSRGLL